MPHWVLCFCWLCRCLSQHKLKVQLVIQQVHLEFTCLFASLCLSWLTHSPALCLCVFSATTLCKERWLSSCCRGRPPETPVNSVKQQWYTALQTPQTTWSNPINYSVPWPLWDRCAVSHKPKEQTGGGWYVFSQGCEICWPKNKAVYDVYLCASHSGVAACCERLHSVKSYFFNSVVSAW